MGYCANTSSNCKPTRRNDSKTTFKARPYNRYKLKFLLKILCNWLESIKLFCTLFVIKYSKVEAVQDKVTTEQEEIIAVL